MPQLVDQRFFVHGGFAYLNVVLAGSIQSPRSKGYIEVGVNLGVKIKVNRQMRRWSRFQWQPTLQQEYNTLVAQSDLFFDGPALGQFKVEVLR